MYIKSLKLDNARTFVKTEIEFVHPDKAYARPKTPPDALQGRLPRPRLPNVNLLLGDNGSGKSTVLRAIAMAALGPVAETSGVRDPGIVRSVGDVPKDAKARIEAEFVLHPQDQGPVGAPVFSEIEIGKRGDVEQIR